MTRLLLALALAAGSTASFADTHDPDADPSCYNFMALGETDRIAVVAQLLGDETVTEDAALGAFNACETDPDASVADALRSMADG